MKVLVVGGGGREHALVWKIARSPLVDEIVAAPGNAGIGGTAAVVPVRADDTEGLVRLAMERDVGLVVVGPELPLTQGLADRMEAASIPVFGPTQSAARLEGSKWFAKELMLRAGIPTASAMLATSRDEALASADDFGYPVVVKADGLAAGKGVTVAGSREAAATAIEEALVRGRFGASGRRVLIEEYLEGEEASVMAIVDGPRSALLVSSQDHKRAYDGDRGPNTGGMGAYAPAPVMTEALLRFVKENVIDAAVRGLCELDGTVYRGVLYAGLMITGDGPKVLEFNCRFGDPETQAVLPLLDADLVEIMASTAAGELDPSCVRVREGASACVVVASGGYPGPYEKGKPIRGLADASALDRVTVFHAGTARERDGFVTSGGRVLGVTGTGKDLPEAIETAYQGIRNIDFEGAFYRSDIGRRALVRIEGSSVK